MRTQNWSRCKQGLRVLQIQIGLRFFFSLVFLHSVMGQKGKWPPSKKRKTKAKQQQKNRRKRKENPNIKNKFSQFDASFFCRFRFVWISHLKRFHFISFLIWFKKLLSVDIEPEKGRKTYKKKVVFDSIFEQIACNNNKMRHPPRSSKRKVH